MKRFYCLIMVAWNLSAMSEVSAQSFIRIYDHHGRKIGKGTVELVADTVVVIKNDGDNYKDFWSLKFHLLEQREAWAPV